MSAELGPLVITRRNCAEPIRANGETVARLADFWSWACSDLANNTMRGLLAEYLVATALGAAAGTRTEWDTVDIRTSDGWRVEVKSTAYLQSWGATPAVEGRVRYRAGLGTTRSAPRRSPVAVVTYSEPSSWSIATAVVPRRTERAGTAAAKASCRSARGTWRYGAPNSASASRPSR